MPNAQRHYTRFIPVPGSNSETSKMLNKETQANVSYNIDDLKYENSFISD